jgi:hypothetical protein
MEILVNDAAVAWFTPRAPYSQDLLDELGVAVAATG